ncbi:hypothetical protein, fragment [Candidatus Moduliflexus flocculans]|uniref:Glycoside hydrolase family 5 domain-containing protein n=1 Tax=Candidatus Moduliflexus flocculans TaxID=1499966 RepID=A0A081BRV2_9BACT|nr:hypothetical protein, fragment [Candidatus Moduliflexus flocculans]
MAFPGKITRNGNRLQLQNFTGEPRFFFIEEFALIHYFNEGVFSWIDKIVACGANGMRTMGIYVYDKGQEQQPFVKSGSSFLLDQFNQPFFDYMKRWVKYANDKGVVVLFEFFDNCLFWATEYTPYDPFYPHYQHAGDHYAKTNAFTDLKNSKLMQLQKNYIRKVVETVQGYDNIIFGIMNEYIGSQAWHSEIAKYVKEVSQNRYLVAGCDHNSPATADPYADIWFVHTGNRDFLTSGTPHVSEDIDALRKKTGEGKALGYSNDGFGDDGPRETPNDMERLTRDAANKGIQLLGFMDHKSWIPTPGQLGPLNEATYKAISAVFRPAPLGPVAKFKLDARSYVELKRKNVPDDLLKKLELLKDKEYLTEAEFLLAVQGTIGRNPTEQYKTLLVKYATIGRPVEGFVDIADVASLYSNHPNVAMERGGKAIYTTTAQGFLAFGYHKSGLPTVPLQAVFSIMIDNNTHDDANILILDVYDQRRDRIIANKLITRKDFPKAGDFSLFKLDFTPPSMTTDVEIRIFYFGNAYVCADKIGILDPADAAGQTDAELLNALRSGQASGGDSGSSSGAEGWTLVLEDKLTDGKTQAQRGGEGKFKLNEGYAITGRNQSYLLYNPGITKSIRVEFDAKGYIPAEPMYGNNDQMSLIVMQDVPHGTNWVNWRSIDGFLFQLQKLAKFENSTDGLKLKAGAALRTSFDGEWKTYMGQGLVGHPLAWDSSKTYHWTVVFQPGNLEISRDSQLIFKYWIDPKVFGSATQPIVVYIGGDFGANNVSPQNVTYSNVKIYRS